jgi:hypothetical protein
MIVVIKMEIVEIIDVVEVIVDQKKFLVEIKIEKDQDQGKSNIINK